MKLKKVVDQLNLAIEVGSNGLEREVNQHSPPLSLYSSCSYPLSPPIPSHLSLPSSLGIFRGEIGVGYLASCHS